jgi:hypothetical protein
MLKKLYVFNHQSNIWAIKNYTAGSHSQKQNPSSIHEWGGGRTRRLLQAAYTVAFLCLLRVDEVLKIQAHDIEILSATCYKLTLPFRKTNQFGGTVMFVDKNVILLTPATFQKFNHLFCMHYPKQKHIFALFVPLQSG